MIEDLKRLWHKYALCCAENDIVKAKNKHHEAEIDLWNAKNSKHWHEKRLSSGHNGDG